jgi:hypothetical protein
MKKLILILLTFITIKLTAQQIIVVNPTNIGSCRTTSLTYTMSWVVPDTITVTSAFFDYWYIAQNLSFLSDARITITAPCGDVYTNPQTIQNINLSGTGVVVIPNINVDCMIPGETLTIVITYRRTFGGLQNCGIFYNYIPATWFWMVLEYIPLVPLSITYGDIKYDCDKVKWKTYSEQNSLYFLLEKNGVIIDRIYANGFSNKIINYEFNLKGDGIYDLIYVDGNGKSEVMKTFYINCTYDKYKYVKKITDILGREVNSEYKGVVIYYYNDGTYEKKVIN